METNASFLFVVLGFLVLALASSQIGRFFARLHLPLISGFLFAGILFGPYELGFIPAEAVERLHIIDEISLAFIAFAAGSELYLKELSGRLRSIAWVTIGNTLAVPVLGTLAIFLLADYVPFMRDFPTAGRLAVALLAGAILVARSPSSAIAIVNELRARGPFTQTVLGVTMLTDVVVIVVFAFNSEIADALLTNVSFSVGFLALLFFELALSLLLGGIVGVLLRLALSWRVDGRVKAALILGIGYAVFYFTGVIRTTTHTLLPVEILLEPLLICMIASFLVVNRSSYRDEFLKLLGEMAPPIYVVFFTLTGASLALDTLAETWQIALILFAVRLLAIFIGSYGGGAAAGDPPLHNRVSWLTYVTQAGVGLGLAKEVAVEFPGWGADFATMIISVVVVNQILGPPLFKWAVNQVGEAHRRAAGPPPDAMRKAVIFGVDSQSVALAHQLRRHGWDVQLACSDETYFRPADTAAADIAVAVTPRFDEAALRALGLETADALVAMLSDDENHRICELAYEHFGTPTMVVRLHERANFRCFHELGALIVEPSTAMVGLLDHFVRSPTAASLLLGMARDQDVVELEVGNASLDGVALRELRLPLDTLILSVQRDGETLISHGYTELRVGDRVTVVGSVHSLDRLTRRFAPQTSPSVAPERP